MRSNLGEVGIIALDSATHLAEGVNKHLMKLMEEKTDEVIPEKGYLISSAAPRFANGEGKGVLNESVGGKDIFILSDIGNHYDEYQFFGESRAKSPDEHFMDIIRMIGAIGGEAYRIHVIMPLLYESRQHRRKQRE